MLLAWRLPLARIDIARGEAVTFAMIPLPASNFAELRNPLPCLILIGFDDLRTGVRRAAKERRSAKCHPVCKQPIRCATVNFWQFRLDDCRMPRREQCEFAYFLWAPEAS